MRVGLISGHGAGDCGALGCGYQESDLTIEVVKALDSKLQSMGIETKVYPYDRNAFYDCRDNGGLKMDFRDCNYVLEVHFNACVNDPEGNDHVTGTEIWVTSMEEHVSVEELILSKMADIGFTNRGVKVTDFSVIYAVKSQGVSSALIETCFIDDKDDMDLFMDNRDEVINAIAYGIAEGFGFTPEETEPEPEPQPEPEPEPEEEEDNINPMDYDNDEFIERIAKVVNDIKGEFGICVASPIIAQACLESAYGKSDKARFYNFFGLKYRKNRVSCHSGTFNADSMEQNTDGSYEPCNTDWYSFDSFENAVRGYFEFINNAGRYDNLKGITDPREYLETIKADGYATANEYVDNVMDTLTSNDLTRYDVEEKEPEVPEVPEVTDDTINIVVKAYSIIGDLAVSALTGDGQDKDNAIGALSDIVNKYGE